MSVCVFVHQKTRCECSTRPLTMSKHTYIYIHTHIYLYKSSKREKKKRYNIPFNCNNVYAVWVSHPCRTVILSPWAKKEAKYRFSFFLFVSVLSVIIKMFWWRRICQVGKRVLSLCNPPHAKTQRADEEEKKSCDKSILVIFSRSLLSLHLAHFHLYLSHLTIMLSSCVISPSIHTHLYNRLPRWEVKKKKTSTSEYDTTPPSPEPLSLISVNCFQSCSTCAPLECYHQIKVFLFLMI